MEKELKVFLRSKLRSYYLDIFGYFSLPKAGVHILNGHKLSSNDINNDVFRKQLDELSKYVEFVNFQDAVKLITDKSNVSKPMVAFSFDDGFEECYTYIAPILEEYKINASFFINPNFVEGDDTYIENFTQNIVKTPNKKPMRWEQIVDLHKRGFIIGAHTLDHYNINDDNIEELERQILDCKKIIEEKINDNCYYFAFPYGKLSHANNISIDIACKFYKFIFSQSDYKKYFSFDGRVINRRHFEPNWPINHLKYFLSSHKK